MAADEDENGGAKGEAERSLELEQVFIVKVLSVINHPILKSARIAGSQSYYETNYWTVRREEWPIEPRRSNTTRYCPRCNRPDETGSELSNCRLLG